MANNIIHSLLVTMETPSTYVYWWRPLEICWDCHHAEHIMDVQKKGVLIHYYLVQIIHGTWKNDYWRRFISCFR